jgi:hypothetical protein
MDEYFDFSSYIVPPILEGPPPSSSQGASYETPYWWDTVNRAIERAAQVATVATAGYPQYPSYPAPSPQITQYPTGQAPTVQAPSGSIQLSNTTLMLIVGGALLFILGKRGR